jgi:hypothetical protein
MSETKRIKLRRGTRAKLSRSTEVLYSGEVVLIDSSGNGYDSLVIGNGKTQAKELQLIPLNVSSGSVFLGLANPDTIPGKPAQESFYLAEGPGNYRRFGLEVKPGEVAFLRWQNLGWSKISIEPIKVDSVLSLESTNPVQNKVITRKLNELEGRIPTIDSELSRESENPVMNRTVTNKICEIDDWYVD